MILKNYRFVNITVPTGDISRFLYQGERNTKIFNSDRRHAIDAAVSRMEVGKPSRFVNMLAAPASDGSYVPDYTFESKDLVGDIDGPDG